MIQLTFLRVSTPMAQNISKKEIDMEKKNAQIENLMVIGSVCKCVCAQT